MNLSNYITYYIAPYSPYLWIVAASFALVAYTNGYVYWLKKNRNQDMHQLFKRLGLSRDETRITKRKKQIIKPDGSRDVFWDNAEEKVTIYPRWWLLSRYTKYGYRSAIGFGLNIKGFSIDPFKLLEVKREIESNLELTLSADGPRQRGQKINWQGKKK